MRRTIGLFAVALALSAVGCGGQSDANTNPCASNPCGEVEKKAGDGTPEETAVAGPECPPDVDPDVCLEEMVQDTAVNGLQLGASIDEAVAIFGPADAAPTEPVLMEANGLWYSELFWEAQGVMVSLEATAEPGPYTVGGIGIMGTSTAKTSEGIGIGASAAEILTAYGMDPAGVGSDANEVLIGSPYFGISFALENDKVVGFYFGTLAE